MFCGDHCGYWAVFSTCYSEHRRQYWWVLWKTSDCYLHWGEIFFLVLLRPTLLRFFGSTERSLDDKSRSFNQRNAFDGSRKDINAAIDRICEYTGNSCLVRFQEICNVVCPPTPPPQKKKKRKNRGGWGNPVTFLHFTKFELLCFCSLAKSCRDQDCLLRTQGAIHWKSVQAKSFSIEIGSTDWTARPGKRCHVLQLVLLMMLLLLLNCSYLAYSYIMHWIWDCFTMFVSYWLS